MSVGFQPVHAIEEAAENFGGDQNLSLIQTTTIFKVMEEQLKFVHQLVDSLDRTNRKTCVTLLRHNVDKSEGFSA